MGLKFDCLFLTYVTIHGIWSMIIKASLSKGVKYAFVSIHINNGFYYIFETRRKVIFWNVSKSCGTSHIFNHFEKCFSTFKGHNSITFRPNLKVYSSKFNFLYRNKIKKPQDAVKNSKFFLDHPVKIRFMIKSLNNIFRQTFCSDVNLH